MARRWSTRDDGVAEIGAPLECYTLNTADLVPDPAHPMRVASWIIAEDGLATMTTEPDPDGVGDCAEYVAYQASHGAPSGPPGPTGRERSEPGE